MGTPLSALDLLARLIHASGAGWPGGFLPYLMAVLAGTLGGLHWYVPAGALAGGVVAAASSSWRGGAGVAGATAIAGAVGVAFATGLITFALNGFVGPHVLHELDG